MGEDQKRTVQGICPGDCFAGEAGHDLGHGSCNAETAECTCNAGWSGPDCSDATCCPPFVFYGIATAAILICGCCMAWCLVAKFGCCRSKADKEEEKANKGKKKKKSSSKGETDAGTVPLEGVTTVPNQRSGNAVLPTGVALTRSQTTRVGAEVSSPEAQHRTPPPGEPLRMAATAWGQTAAPTGVSQTNVQPAGKPVLRRAQTEQLGRSKPDLGGPNMGHTKTDASGPTVAHAKTDKTDPGGRSPIPGSRGPGSDFDRQSSPKRFGGRSEPDPGSPLALNAVPDLDDDCSPQVKQVHEKMRDMMDQPTVVRKKIFKELLVEYHPDKNSSEHATEVFQAVNGARTWFLHDHEA